MKGNMGQQIDFLECQGKTIKQMEKPSYGGGIFILFTDGDWSFINPIADGGDCVEIDTNPDPDLMGYYNCYPALRLGLITQDQLDQYNAAVKAKREARELESERQQYEALKKKFETK